ncbi:MAG: hypothetical protein LBI53_05970 [Candidatus Peribacteria bacterium]|jgi:hypothetical protein|nr:hypothetical protein [Candidatus Peribacteria bacterium]
MNEKLEQNDMEIIREINIPATVQEILNWASRSKYHTIKKRKFNQASCGPEPEVQEFLLEVCKFCEIEPVLDDDEES